MNANGDLIPEELVEAVECLAEVFAERSVRYALIGGLATSMRGRPRFTKDVVFLVDVPQLAQPGLLDALIKRGFSLDPETVIKEYVREHITAFSFRSVRIDWLKPILDFHVRALSDAKPLQLPKGGSLWVATPEGLILTKMVAFRPQDQLDIETLVTANRGNIDLGLIRQEWSPFAASEPERTTWLEAVIAGRVVRRE